MRDIEKRFKNPPNAYRAKPFWSWNGALEKQELMRQIDIMRDMGFGGYFMHPRTGLQTEYLGEEWFELINACTEKGKEYGLEAWLYDEDRWPSGSAGGLVTDKPQFRAKYLAVEIFEGKSFEWCQEYIAVFVADLDGVNYTTSHRIKADTAKNIYENNKVLAFSVKEMDKSSFYNGNTYLDTINQRAVEAFIQSTHEKYKEYCGDEFGKGIKGIFTDEPHRGGLFTQFYGDVNKVPYTEDIFEQFKQRYRYDLIEHLPELYYIKGTEKISPVKWQFVELLQTLFIERFAKPINKWCQENGLILTGHVLHEDNLTAQVTMQGSLMRFYEHMEYPGVDVLFEGNRAYWIVKQLVSVARQTGKKWLLSELYGCTGWQMSLEGHKNVGDWQALFGINIRCPHLSWYTMQGEAKRDFPASILHQSAWYKEYKYVEDYFSRIHVFMEQGKPECNLLVINPVESMWARVYSGCFDWITAVDKDMERLERQYAEVFQILAGNRIDFDYGDEDILARLGEVVKTTDETLVKVGEATYKKILIAGADTLRASTLNLLKQFKEKGGEVIFAGNVPEYIDAVQTDEAVAFADTCQVVGLNEIAIAELCKSGVEIGVTDKDGKNIADVFAQTRTDCDARYIMVLNVNRDLNYPVLLDLGEGNYAEQWEPSTGQLMIADTQVRSKRIYIQTILQAGEERLYVVKNGDYAGINHAKKTVEAIQLPIEYCYSLDEPNICVLDYASARLNQGEWSIPTEVLKADQMLRKQLGVAQRGGIMVQPWYQKKFGGNTQEILGDISLKYDVHIDELPKSDIEIAMEQSDECSVVVNGIPINRKEFKGFWIDICFSKATIPKEILKKGHNEIIVQMPFKQETNIEAIYLLGNFGVQIEGNKKIITALPNTLKIGDITHQGLPFYSGKVAYHCEVQDMQGKKATLSIKSFEGACVKAVNAKGERIIWKKPYQCDITDLVADNNRFDIELVLTRRNTFGPLHELPKISDAYGPNNFITEGESFTDNYVLFEQGLMQEPTIELECI